jgi:hypothetical protein
LALAIADANRNVFAQELVKMETAATIFEIDVMVGHLGHLCAVLFVPMAMDYWSK